jgi:hypothetical protein
MATLPATAQYSTMSCPHCGTRQRGTDLHLTWTGLVIVDFKGWRSESDYDEQLFLPRFCYYCAYHLSEYAKVLAAGPTIERTFEPDWEWELEWG